jgi:hypothetical protein
VLGLELELELELGLVLGVGVRIRTRRDEARRDDARRDEEQHKTRQHKTRPDHTREHNTRQEGRDKPSKRKRPQGNSTKDTATCAPAISPTNLNIWLYLLFKMAEDERLDAVRMLCYVFENAGEIVVNRPANFVLDPDDNASDDVSACIDSIACIVISFLQYQIRIPT